MDHHYSIVIVEQKQLTLSIDDNQMAVSLCMFASLLDPFLLSRIHHFRVSVSCLTIRFDFSLTDLQKVASHRTARFATVGFDNSRDELIAAGARAIHPFVSILSNNTDHLKDITSAKVFR